MMLLAALEVARRGEVRLEQAVPFGDIAIIPVGAPT
jgi:chromatin segregation and condensation protein Rec8/ScpA/Scc1 (kleisin family)